MLGKIGRIVSFLLLSWFVFMVSAMVLAALKRREAVPQEPDADEVDLVASFGPLEYKSTAQAFRGGKVETWFGGGVVDLREARLDPAGATLEVNALFGGGNLIVPEDWKVEASVMGIGGVGDARPRFEREETAPTLRIEGRTIFGGWGVTSERPDGRGDEVFTPV
jgi:predicted membrane protein